MANPQAFDLVFVDGEVRGFSALAASIELSTQGPHSWHPILEAGVWEHPARGSVQITVQDLREVEANFRLNIPTLAVPVDELEAHTLSTTGAYGWLVDMRLDGAVLMGRIDWTPQGVEAIRSTLYAYRSPRVFTRTAPYTSTVDGRTIPNVITAIALTNHPVMTTQPQLALALSEYTHVEDGVADMDPQTDTQDGAVTTTPPDTSSDVPTDGPADTPTPTPPAQPSPIATPDPGDVTMSVPPQTPPPPAAPTPSVPSKGPTTPQAIDFAHLVLQNDQLRRRLDQMDEDRRRVEVAHGYEGLTFSTTVLSQHGQQTRAYTYPSGLTPRAVDLSTRVTVALQNVDAQLAAEFSQGVRDQAFTPVVLSELGVAFGAPSDDEDDSWLTTTYPPDTVAAIVAKAKSDNITLRAASRLVLAERYQ